jgi:hypothetical protein
MKDNSFQKRMKYTKYILPQYTFDISIKILVKKFININFILHFASRYQNQILTQI